MKNWKDINWTKINLIVYDLQCKIFKATVNKSNSKAKMRYYQKTLHHPLFKRLRGTLVKQNHKCSYCNITFSPDDIIELHHVRDSNGVWLGKFQFVHGHCHDKIHGEKKKM